MAKNWINTIRDDDARKRIGEYWNLMRSDQHEGKFWADQIKEYKEEPEKRLSLALNNLPLPAAFREAAIAIRAIIRSKRKVNEDFEDELTLLYWLAAIRSFMLDYAPRLEEPGYNVIESIPAKRMRSLNYDYSELGYNKLSLLNKTDVKWLTKAWGEPTTHRTLNDIHRELWDEYETRLISKRKQENKRQKSEWDQRLNAKQDNKGCSIFLVIMVTAILSWVWKLNG